MVAGLRRSGVVAPWVFASATDNAAFPTYGTDVLVPELRPGDVVVWDHLQPHGQAAAGATLKPLPARRPDLIPSEKWWPIGNGSKVAKLVQPEWRNRKMYRHHLRTIFRASGSTTGPGLPSHTGPEFQAPRFELPADRRRFALPPESRLC